MKKAYRIKKEQEFQKVFKEGTSTANRQLVLYVYPKAEQVHFRVGLSVGKKIGNAVKRNRVKRFLRQALLELEAHIRPDVDFLLIARQDIYGKTFAQVKQSVIHVMKLANLFHDEKTGGIYEKNN